MQPRSPEASDAGYARLARPRRWPRAPRRRDLLAGDNLFAFLEPGEDLRIDPIGDADHDVTRFLAPVILDDGHRGGTRPQPGFRVVARASASASASASTTG